MTDNTGRHLAAGHEHILCSVTTVVPHRVAFYVELDGETSLIHTRSCHNQPEARDFALTMLLNAYLLVDEPLPLRRLYWCELIPLRRDNGQWIPDPAADGHIDAAYLNSETGQISFELDASMCRQHSRQARAVVDSHIGAAPKKPNGRCHGFPINLPALPEGMTEWDADTVLSGEPLDQSALGGGVVPMRGLSCDLPDDSELGGPHAVTPEDGRSTCCSCGGWADRRPAIGGREGHRRCRCTV